MCLDQIYAHLVHGGGGPDLVEVEVSEPPLALVAREEVARELAGAADHVQVHDVVDEIDVGVLATLTGRWSTIRKTYDMTGQ